jgi:hypothetical protein
MLRLEPVNLDAMNEADVREEILAKIVEALGYRAGGPHRLVREQSLRYPRISLGHKKAGDPELRGRADYICEADGSARWVLEAKPPFESLDIDAIEQAYSYANHPEVRAVYFAVSNGREFRVYQTSAGPVAEPIIALGLEELESKFQLLGAVLSPAAIQSRFAKVEVDLNPPLAPGLRSLVRVDGGTITIDGEELAAQGMSGYTLSVIGGAVQRRENGGLLAYVETLAPFSALQRDNERLGISRIECSSSDNHLSTDPAYPTRFSSAQRVYLARGAEIFNVAAWRDMTLPMDVIIEVATSIEGVVSGKRFEGKFSSRHVVSAIGMTLRTTGSVALRLT